MQARKVVFMFSLLLLLTGFIFNVYAAPTNTVGFRGSGVIVDLVFPEEAHPLDNIYHNLTIAAYTYLSSLNITLYIYAPVNSVWQIIDPPHTLDWQYPLGVNASLPAVEILFALPHNTDGTLRCTLVVQTNQTADSSFTFHTTEVHTLTYSELLSAHNDYIANYTALSNAYNQLNASYNALLIEHSILTANYSALLSDYGTLLASYNTLLTEYITLNSTYNNLTSDYRTLNSTYNSLLASYANLNATYTSLLAQNAALQTNYTILISTHNALLANYNSLLASNNALQSNYDQLDSDNTILQTLYNSLLDTNKTLQTNYSSLISTNNLLREAYDVLRGNYSSLEAQVDDLLQRINISENDLNTDRVFMFISLMAVAGLIALVIYLKRKEPEPYVVIRKETVAARAVSSTPKPNPTTTSIRIATILLNVEQVFKKLWVAKFYIVFRILF